MNRVVRRYLVTLPALALALFSCFFAQTASASTVVVSNSSPPYCKAGTHFATIGSAVAAVPSGSTIYICPGTYPEQVTIHESLTLTGLAGNGLTGANASGADNPVITSPGGGVIPNATDLYDGSPIAAQIAVVTPSNALATPIKVTVNYLSIDGSNNQLSDCSTDLVGIYYQNANGTINHDSTRNQELSPDLFGCQQGLAIYVESGYASGGTASVTIENSNVHSYDKNGITVVGSGTTATITGNYVVGIGATPLIAQNGIQVSDGANGKVSSNTVTDDVYISPDGGPYYSASGILLYDSGGTNASNLVVSGNTISNTQGAIVAYADSSGTADYNSITSNKITTSPAAGPFLIDGIDLCSNYNTATSNIVYNSSGAGIHIDSQCTESSGGSGINTNVTKNTIDEACAGVLTGTTGTGSSSGNSFFNVVQTTFAGDSCPSGAPAHAKTKLKPHPWRP